MSGLERRTAVLKTLSPGDSRGFPGAAARPFIPCGILNFVTTAGRANYMRFVPEEDLFVTKLSIICTVLDGANPLTELAIYDSAQNKLASTGNVTGVLNATGVRTVSLAAPILLTAGTVYYLAFSTASAGVATVQAYNLNAAVHGQIFGNAPPNLEMGAQAGSNPLPNPAAMASGANNDFIIIVARTD